jgi:hypothetical protein
MDLTTTELQYLQTFKADPSNQSAVYSLATIFWNRILGSIGRLIREKGDLREFVKNEKELLDFGLLNDLREDRDAVLSSLSDGFGSYPLLKVRHFSDWLIETVEEILLGNEQDLVKKDIERTRFELIRFRKDSDGLKKARNDLLAANISTDAKPRAARLRELDEMLFSSLKTRKETAKGVFFPVEQRRAFVEKETRLKKELEFLDSLASQVKDLAERAAFRDYNEQISAILSQIVSTEDSISSLEKKMEELKVKRETMSVMEIESRASRAIEYIRDLLRLSARRLHLESCSILREKDQYFTSQKLFDCLDRIQEFDPRIFVNDRSSYIGKPSVLIVPGNGNAVYDWKNNMLLVPFVPPNADFMGSVAAGIIEYRLDVDEDKKLLTSYAELPEYKGTKSLFKLKNSLKKDYTIWMTNEYKGFRILSKDTKRWFEHEIAPSRREIFCPPEYRQFNLNQAAFKTLIEETESRLALTGDDEADLWAAGILNFQDGKLDRAYEYMKTLISKNTNRVFAYYNMGHICMQASRKQDAISGFTEFVRRNPQGWWTSVAREHIRTLSA